MSELTQDNAAICFRVYGLPKPGGSKRAFAHPHAKAANGKPRIIVVDDCQRNKEWRANVAYTARENYNGPPLTGPLHIIIMFYLPRPKSHFGTGKNKDKMKTSAPVFPIGKPDATKLLRSTEDALTGLLWRDDAQVVMQDVSKYYCSSHETPGANIAIRPLPDVGTEWGGKYDDA